MWRIRQTSPYERRYDKGTRRLAMMVVERGEVIKRLQRKLGKRKRKYARLHREIKRLRTILREHGIEA